MPSTRRIYTKREGLSRGKVIFLHADDADVRDARRFLNVVLLQSTVTAYCVFHPELRLRLARGYYLLVCYADGGIPNKQSTPLIPRQRGRVHPLTPASGGDATGHKSTRIVEVFLKTLPIIFTSIPPLFLPVIFKYFFGRIVFFFHAFLL